MAQDVCSVEDCDGIARKRGWCRKHYTRWQRHGDPFVVHVPLGANERFWAKVTKTATCWLWSGAISGGGYGHLFVTGRSRLAHRFAYELLVGPVPVGRELDHLCRIRACVNPAHLEPVTHRENVRRGSLGRVTAERNRAKTHCPNGHPYDEGNTYLRPDGRGRDCRACKSTRMKRYYERLG